MTKRPSFQFYPADWRKDPAVQALNYHDRGVWFELICLMHESDERGVLLLNGKPMPIEALSNLLNIEENLLNQILSKFIDYGVAKVRLLDGAIYNKRMVEDEKLSQTRAESGKKGGNPTLLNQNPSKLKAKQKQTDKQSTTPSSSSSSSSSSSDIDDNDSKESSSSSCTDDEFLDSFEKQKTENEKGEVLILIEDVIQARIDEGLEVRNRQGLVLAMQNQLLENPFCVESWKRFLSDSNAKKHKKQSKILSEEKEKIKKHEEEEEQFRLKQLRHHWNAQFKKIKDQEIKDRIKKRAEEECQILPNGDHIQAHLSALIAKYTEEEISGGGQ